MIVNIKSQRCHKGVMLAGDAGQIAAERAECSSVQAAAPFPPANSSPLPVTPR